MTKSELVKEVALEAEISEVEASNAVDAILNAIKDTVVSGDKICLTGFGTFERRNRKERECVNPQTKEKMVVPAHFVPAFKASKALKAIVAELPIDTPAEA